MEENLNLENTAEKVEEGKTSKFKLKYIIGIVAVIAVAAFVFAMPKEKKIDIKEKPVVYVKDNALYMYDANGETKLADNMGNTSAYSNFFFGYGNTYNEDNSVMYFQSDISEFGAYTLSRVSTTASSGVEKIDSDVITYNVSDDGSKVAYIKMDSNGLSLFSSDGKEKNLIRDNIGMNDYYFQLSGDGEDIYYLEQTDEGTLDCVKVGFDGSGKTVAASDIDEFALMEGNQLVYGRYSDDGTGALFCLDKKGNEKLISDEMAGISFFENNEGCIFLEEGVKNIDIWDVVVDDMAETDKNMQPPLFADYGHERQDEYLAASDEYARKQVRDTVRKQIEEERYTGLGYVLYKFDGNKMTKLAENVVDVIVFGENGEHILIDQADYTEDGYKILLSELTDISYIPYMYAYYDRADKTFVISGDVMAPIEYGDVDIQSSLYDEQSGKLMFAKDVDANGVFNPIIVEMNKGEVAKYSYIEDRVNFADFYGNGDFAYVSSGGKLITFNNGSTTMHDENVSFMTTDKDNGAIYYISDMSAEDYTGSLCMLKNGEITTVDSAVTYVSAIGNGKVVYIRNYDETAGVGDVFVCDNGNTKLVAENVSCVMDMN
ncbi:MAG: hypothetical protein IJF29_06710 [Firmicutes bacterium]|nr:hypothetical protein [Bacillota bacterium]